MKSSADRFIELAADLIGTDAANAAKRSYKRRWRAFMKLVKVGALMLAAAIVIPVTMITAGLLLGPRGYEGLIAAPLSVLVAWAGIWFFAYRSPATPTAIAKADLPQLPSSTEAWLEQQRAQLPSEAQPILDAIGVRLESLRPQARMLTAATPGASELRRLLAEELPDLVHGYQKVPQALKRRPLHGGPSPDQQLLEGLATIDAQIGRVHERLAANDLHTLATQQRYLEIKYKDGGDKGE